MSQQLLQHVGRGALSPVAAVLRLDRHHGGGIIGVVHVVPLRETGPLVVVVSPHLIPQEGVLVPVPLVFVVVGRAAARLGKHPFKEDLLLVGGEVSVALSVAELFTKPRLPHDVFEKVVVRRFKLLVFGKAVLELGAEVAEGRRSLELALGLDGA